MNMTDSQAQIDAAIEAGKGFFDAALEAWQQTTGGGMPFFFVVVDGHGGVGRDFLAGAPAELREIAERLRWVVLCASVADSGQVVEMLPLDEHHRVNVWPSLARQCEEAGVVPVVVVLDTFVAFANVAGTEAPA